MKILSEAHEKISSSSRLNFDELLALYEENDLLYPAKSARHVKEIHSGSNVTLHPIWLAL